MDKVGGFLLAVGRFLAPWCKTTPVEKLGNYLWVAAAILCAVGQAWPLLFPAPPPPVVEVVAPVVKPAPVEAPDGAPDAFCEEE